MNQTKFIIRIDEFVLEFKIERYKCPCLVTRCAHAYIFVSRQIKNPITHKKEKHFLGRKMVYINLEEQLLNKCERFIEDIKEELKFLELSLKDEDLILRKIFKFF